MFFSTLKQTHFKHFLLTGVVSGFVWVTSQQNCKTVLWLANDMVQANSSEVPTA